MLDFYKLGFFSETHANFRPIERYAYIRHLPNQFDEIFCLTWWETLLSNDQNMALITRWCWWWLGCWCSCSLRAGLGPGTGLGFCLWLSFTQIAESCLWEPKIWSPGIPGGIFGRTAQLSSLFCGWGGFWVGPLAFVGYRAVPWGAWVLALWSLLVLPLLICHPLFRNC